MAKFKTVANLPNISGHQITCNVIREDGKIIRSGLWPDIAEKDCNLLNECFLNNWGAEKYHEMRKLIF